MSYLRKIANAYESNSWATRLRRRRFELFLGLLKQLPPPIRILDVGGTEWFWRTMGFRTSAQAHLTLLNSVKVDITMEHVTSVVGDARQMTHFADKSFDVVFSNSVIEHLATFEEQQRMSVEVRRVGERYFIQTPNKYFLMDPHFLFPGFQFFPLRAQVWIASHYTVGWYCQPKDPVAAEKAVRGIRMLSQQEFQALFPDGVLFKERFCGTTKSFILYGGWARPAP